MSLCYQNISNKTSHDAASVAVNSLQDMAQNIGMTWIPHDSAARIGWLRVLDSVALKLQNNHSSYNL